MPGGRALQSAHPVGFQPPGLSVDVEHGRIAPGSGAPRLHFEAKVSVGQVGVGGPPLRSYLERVLAKADEPVAVAKFGRAVGRRVG